MLQALLEVESHVSEPENDADDLDVEKVIAEISTSWDGKTVVPLLNELIELRRVVRALTETVPVAMRTDIGMCLYCEGYCGGDDVRGHNEDCPWVEAREIMYKPNGEAK